MNAEELCRKWEVAINKHRQRPLTENEIIVATWTSVCNRLQEASFDSSLDELTKKSLRSASRQIRGCLTTGKKCSPKSKNIEMLKKASALAYSMTSEHLEYMTAYVDEMARLIMAGHVLKRRLNACRERLIHAIMVIGRNIEDLKEYNK